MDGPSALLDSQLALDGGTSEVLSSASDGPSTDTRLVDALSDTLVTDIRRPVDTLPVDMLSVDALPVDVLSVDTETVDTARDLPPDQTLTPDSPVDVSHDIAPPDTPIEALAQGALVYYPADSVSGTRLPDLSGHSNDGTIAGPVKLVPGKVGRALLFSATAASGTTGPSGTYVSMPANLLSTSKAMTIATWIRMNSNTAWQRIFEIGSSTSNTLFLTPYTDSSSPHMRLSIEVEGVSKQFLDGPPIPVGAWTHVAVVMDRANCRLYTDGVVQAFSTLVTLRPTDLGATTHNWIGKSSFDNRSDPTKNDPYLDGQIDEFRIYDRALSDNEIKFLSTP